MKYIVFRTLRGHNCSTVLLWDSLKVGPHLLVQDVLFTFSAFDVLESFRSNKASNTFGFARKATCATCGPRWVTKEDWGCKSDIL